MTNSELYALRDCLRDLMMSVAKCEAVTAEQRERAQFFLTDIERTPPVYIARVIG